MSSLIKYKRNVPSLYDRDEFLTPFSSFFDDFFNETFPTLSSGFGKDFFAFGSYPKVDVLEENDRVIINAEVPGLTKDQVSVELDGDILRIKGEKKEETNDVSNKKYIHRELKHSSFCRSFVVGNNVHKDSVDAKFENGILTINLKKTVPTPKVEPKKIEVK